MVEAAGGLAGETEVALPRAGAIFSLLRRGAQA